MYYSDEVIEDVRARNDIVDVIGQYVSLKKAGNSYKCCCPFHHEKTPSFTVSRSKQMYHCFGCGAGGNVFTFVMQYENFSFPEAVKYLADRAGITLPEMELSDAEKREAGRKAELKEVNKAAAAYFHYLLTRTERGKIGLKYYKETRQFTDETINNFGLGYADIYADDLYKYLKSKGYSDKTISDAGLVDIDEKRGVHDKFWNRVIVPILDINGKVIAFGGRVLGDAKPKYLNTKETDIFDKSHNIFAMNIARRSRRRGVILCEGYMDVISQHQAGFDNAIASLGTAFTMGQASLIKRYTSEVYLAYDSDGAGRAATMKAIGILREMNLMERVIDLSPYKDPDEFLKNMGAEAYEERIKNAIPGRMFEIDQIAGQYNMNDPEEKTSFVNNTAKLLAGIEDVSQRSNYLDAVARKYMLDRELLKQVVTRYGLAGISSKSVAEENIEKAAVKEERKVTKNKDPNQTSEEILLTWYVNRPQLFKKLEGIISLEDFVDEKVHFIAEKIFEQYKTDGEVNPARIINCFTDADEQAVAASIMSNEFNQLSGPEEESKALTDIVKRVKTASIDYRLKMPGADFIGLAREKNGIQKIKITL